MAQPVTRFSSGRIQVSIWENEGTKGKYHSVRINKRYQDPKSGEWRDSGSFFPSELAALQDLLRQALDYVGGAPAPNGGRTPFREAPAGARQG